MSNKTSHSMRLVIALDMPTFEENLALAKYVRELDNTVRETIWLKIGLRFFIRDGKEGIESIKRASDANIFLDLKLYDIPNTMANAAYECALLGVNMLTIHTSSGLVGMQAVMEKLSSLNTPRPLVMGVSALTSFDKEGFCAVYEQSIDTFVKRASTLCDKAAIDGIVCSCLESKYIKSDYPHLLTLTPGIRPFGAIDDDQKRVASIAQAYNALSDFIVVGRPIYAAKDPSIAIHSILDQIHQVSQGVKGV